MSSHARPAWQLAAQWPEAPGRQEASGSARVERVLKIAIVFAIVSLTILDRFGVRVEGNFSIPSSLVAMYALLAAMVWAGAAELNVRGAVAYLALAGVAAASLMVNSAFAPPASVSNTSFLLLLVIYAPLAMSIRPGAVSLDLRTWTIRLYTAIAVLVALAGIAQYFAQFAFQPAWLFDYTPLIPEPIQDTRGWNTAYNTGQWFKSNGFFMREPSIFSIVVAFGLLCELSLARRRWVMAVLAAGLVLSYSGSGLLCLIAGLLFPLGRGTLMRVLGLGLAAAAIFFVFQEALNLSYTLNRLDEIASPGTSAYCRFVYPGMMAWQQLDSSPWAALIGHGPGSIERMGGTCWGGETTYAKMVFEYGLFGTLALAGLMLGALTRSAAPVRICVAGGVTWLMLGGNLLDSQILLFIYIASAMWPAAAGPINDLGSPSR